MNTHVINFAANKFCPLILIAFLSFYKMGFETFEPFAILGLTFFVAHFNFKTGYAVAFCEKNNIELEIDD